MNEDPATHNAQHTTHHTSIACRDLTCGYPGRPVLTNVTFTAQSGEVIALLGPNGSGKSTLMKTIAKNLAIMSGGVAINGRPISEISFRELAQQVAFVPQEEHSYFPFKVREVVLMGRLPQSKSLLDTAEDLEMGDNALRQADCYDLRDRSIQELSGGERQRVWIARALAQGAKILLLDEPSSHLDVAHQLSLIELVEGLSERGFTVLAAVHDLNLAATIARRGILLRKGTVGIDAPIHEVMTNALLEEVYRVRFERVKDDLGRVRVLPKSML